MVRIGTHRVPLSDCRYARALAASCLPRRHGGAAFTDCRRADQTSIYLGSHRLRERGAALPAKSPAGVPSRMDAASHGDKNAGIVDYATRSIGEAVATVAHEQGGMRPFIMGHSLGGTLAAIYAAFDPPNIRGLVLLSTPLCFAAGSCRFRDAIIAMAPPGLSAMEIIPGSLLSQLSVIAAPDTFFGRGLSTPR